MTVLDRYFQLSDLASADHAAFQELVSLFSDQAQLRPAGTSEVKGKKAIEKFFEGFFKNNVIMRHVWVTQKLHKGLETSWAVAGRRKDGTVFAFQGSDFAELDADGKIRTLEVRITN